MTTLRRLETRNTSDIKIACPLEEGYSTVIGGRTYEFQPGEMVLVERKFGIFLVSRAQKAWEMRKTQAATERREYARRISSNDLAVRDSALKFCNKNGKPHSPTTRCPGLVSLETESGRRDYAVWAEANNPEKATMETEGGTEKIATPPDINFDEIEDPGSLDDGSVPPPEVPNLGWTREEKFDYIRRHADATGIKAWAGLLSRSDMAATLEKRVQETFDILREQHAQGQGG